MDILERIRDRYTPAEIVEKLEINEEDFYNLMSDYILDNIEIFQEDYEE